MIEGIRRAEEKLAQPRVLDQTKPFECWDGALLQEGLWFNWDDHLRDYVALPGQTPPPYPPDRLDPRERRTELLWKGRTIYVQHGWPFDPATWRRLRL